MKDLVQWEPAWDESRAQPEADPERGWGVVVAGSRLVGKKKWIILPQETLSSSDVALICATHNARIKAGSEGSIDVASLVNRDLEPIVQITLGAESAQLGIREARQHVIALHECIEGALSDALLVRFIRDQVYEGREGFEAAVGAMLNAFRKFREQFEGPPVESKSEN